MQSLKTAEQAVRQMWSFSQALDLALVDEEIRKGLKVEVGYQHGERVGYISVRLGDVLGLKGSDLFLLLMAGLMHDIGALGAFADAHGQTKMMELHSQLGAEILRDFPGGEKLYAALLYHHKTPLTKPDAPLMAKIISLADKLDLILPRRKTTYQERADILNRIRACSGTEYYPEVVQALERVADEEAFWLYLSEYNLLSPTLDFMFYSRKEQDCLDYDGICDEIRSRSFVDKLGVIFAFLIDQKSDFTGKHSRRVAENAYKLAGHLGWSEEDRKDIMLAGLLHDLGKLAVPQKILDKPGVLSSSEIEIIKSHTYYTYNLLSAAGFARHIIEWASYHHERLDGKGYPFRLSANDLSIGSRIMTIADMYSALTEDRPYRDGLPAEKALQIIAEGKGRLVDSELFEVARKAFL